MARQPFRVKSSVPSRRRRTKKAVNLVVDSVSDAVSQGLIDCTIPGAAASGIGWPLADSLDHPSRWRVRHRCDPVADSGF
jgi:hypothetical protein